MRSLEPGDKVMFVFEVYSDGPCFGIVKNQAGICGNYRGTFDYLPHNEPVFECWYVDEGGELRTMTECPQCWLHLMPDLFQHYQHKQIKCLLEVEKEVREMVRFLDFLDEPPSRFYNLKEKLERKNWPDSED